MLIPLLFSLTAFLHRCSIPRRKDLTHPEDIVDRKKALVKTFQIKCNECKHIDTLGNCWGIYCVL